MTPTLGTRPVSSVGLATNWRLSTVDNQTHSDLSFDRQRFLYRRLFMCLAPVFSTPAFSTPAFSAFPSIVASINSNVASTMLPVDSTFLLVCSRLNSGDTSSNYWQVLLSYNILHLAKSANN